MESEAVRRGTRNGLGPEPDPLGAGTLGRRDLEGPVLAEKLVQDEALSLAGPAAHGDDADGTVDGAQNVQRRLAHIETARRLVEGHELDGTRHTVENRTYPRVASPFSFDSPSSSMTRAKALSLLRRILRARQAWAGPPEVPSP